MPDLVLEVLTFIEKGIISLNVDEDFMDELDLQLQINETEIEE